MKVCTLMLSAVGGGGVADVVAMVTVLISVVLISFHPNVAGEMRTCGPWEGFVSCASIV